MSNIREIAAKHIEKKAPYTFKDKTQVIDKSGNVKQNKALKQLIIKNNSSRLSMSGITVYLLRLGSQFGGTTPYLCYNEYTDTISIH